MSPVTTQPIEPSATCPERGAATLSAALLLSAVGCIERSMSGSSTRETTDLSPMKFALSLVNPFHHFTSLSRVAEAISGGWNVVILFDNDLPLRLEYVEEARRPKYDQVFNTPEWRTAASLGKEQRGRYALELYKAQLSLRCPDAMIRSYSFKDGQRLIIGCSTLDGNGWLKSMVWSLSDDHGIVDDTDTNHLIRLSPYDDASWRTALRRNLHSRFSGRTVEEEGIRDHILRSTPYPYDNGMLERMVENRFIKKMEGQGGRVRYRFPLGN